MGWPKKLKNIWFFLFLFCLCYFLETITFTYFISSVQSIERQFQISSRTSGSFVSAGDIGYICTVVFLAYFGGKGNRARWIGGGCILIALSCFLISMPGYIFKAPTRESINETLLFSEIKITPTTRMPTKLVEMGDKIAEVRAVFLTPNVTYEECENALLKIGVDPPQFPFPLTEGMKIDLISLAVKWRCDGSNEDVLEKHFRPYFGSYFAEPLVVYHINKAKCLPGGIFRERDPNEQLTALIVPEQVRGRFMSYASGALGVCNSIGNQLKTRLIGIKCEWSKGENKGAMVMVFIGIIFIGVGHSMPWSLGVPLIDDSVKKQNAPLYFGGIFFTRILGPVLGFLVGAALNNIHVTLTTPEGLTSRDVRWVGAWWVGYLLIAATLIIPSLLLFFFPSDAILKEHRRKQSHAGSLHSSTTGRRSSSLKGGSLNYKSKSKDAEAADTQVVLLNGDAKIDEGEGAVATAKDFFRSIKEVMKCPVYVAALSGRLFDAFAFKGFFVFLPKYLINHYGIPPMKANIIIGIVGIVGFALGIPIGATLLRKFKLNGRRAAFFVGLCTFISLCLASSNLLLKCESVVNRIGKEGSLNDFKYNATCHDGCLCDSVSLHPVCAEDGTAFFSPCVAGCEDVEVASMAKMEFKFHNCSCVASEAENGMGSVSLENCKDDCGPMFTIYLVITIIGGIVGGMGVIPSVLIVLRSVPTEHRSVALGFSGFVVSLLSTLPSPMAFGRVVDTACLKWATTCSGAAGACEIYDPDKLRVGTYLFNGVLRILGFLFDIVVWYFALNLNILEEHPEKNKNQSNTEKNGTVAKTTTA